jgi:hypothetical protein
VDLLQVEPPAPQPLRLGKLYAAEAFARRPDLRCREQAGRTHLAQQVADDALGPAIHRGRVDHPAARGEEVLQHGAALLPFERRVADIEREPGAHADRRDALPAARERMLETFRCSRRRRQQRQRRERGPGTQQAAPMPIDCSLHRWPFGL